MPQLFYDAIILSLPSCNPHHSIAEVLPQPILCDCA
jgi:hypothetical protein